jgi:DNA gyrase subunit A
LTPAGLALIIRHETLTPDKRNDAMEVGLVRRIDIDSELQQSYLDYAMSVIVARALPDARDGLKPVHRRILHAMHAMGIRPGSDFKKSARIVGEVLGKYHPHGDMAVYDAMARMAQEFSMRYPLIDGQGNFGSIDGDPPAAMRYTEARMASLAMEMLRDLEKETVAFEPNFDGSLTEPSVLPSSYPNLLVNGATGIAVGMATSIPPHNMVEVCNALIYMLENWPRLDKISQDDLMQFIQGPDFPTGGIIIHDSKTGEDLAAAYGSGRGKVTVQARAHIEDMGRGRSRIIVTELPYQTNKASLIERIADLARAGQLEGLADLRDESDRQGMRIVIELSKSADPEAVLARLYRQTPMQSTFSLIMLALVDGEPRLLSLKQALRVYLEHRAQVVRRRSQYELARAMERLHVLAGLRLALKNLDEVLEMIRAARDSDQAQARLMKRFKLSEIQATAILDMPLRRLAGLERKKIDAEFKSTESRIRELEALLASEKKIRGVIATELADIKDRYGDRRRTQIVQPQRGRRGRPALTARDLVPDKQTWVTVTTKGLISRTPGARLPRLAGRNAPGLLIGSAGRDTLILFDRQGLAVSVAVHTLPECDSPEQGNPVAGATPMPQGTELVAGVALPAGLPPEQAESTFVISLTRQGMIKKSPLSAYPGPSARPFQAVRIPEGDSLAWVGLGTAANELCLISDMGYAIVFDESEVRPMGLAAAGVQAMRLDEGARLVGFGLSGSGDEVFLMTEDGQAKRVALADFPRQRRNGRGVIAWKSGEPALIAGAILGRPDDRAVAHLGRAAARSIRLADAPRRGRAAGGKSLIEVRESDRLTGLTAPLPRLAPVAATESRPPAGKGKARPRAAGAQKAGAAKASPASSKRAHPRGTSRRRRPESRRRGRPASGAVRKGSGKKPTSKRRKSG